MPGPFLNLRERDDMIDATSGRLALLGLLAWTGTAVAQQPPPTPEQRAQTAVETRQAIFKLMNHNMAPIGGMARGTTPFDAAIAERNATRIAQLADMIAETFVPDTRAFKVETRALPKIWDNADDFKAKAQDLIRHATALAAAARSGDQAATIAALRPLGAACSTCHDSNRAE
ncbi:MAG: cytochrome c [Gammaproteobacteria bacterium]|nr:cytochrome c [Gammaproteobacteria bacterium]